MKISLSLLFILLAENFALSQWSTNSGVNNPICTQFDVQNTIQMISDGSGGAIITWIDYRLPGYSIFAQRISGGGSNQWTTAGAQISPASIGGFAPAITGDDHGGAIITWISGTSISAQHINSVGVNQWGSNGVLVCATTATQQAGGAKITGDGSGGAILAWNDSRNNVGINDDDVYAQHVNSNGVIQWAANGVAVVAQTGYQGSLQLSSDGNGGAIIVWEDNRSGTDIDVYAQKVDAAGTMQWSANGVALTSAIGGNEQYLQMVSDAGGAIMCWESRRSGTDFDIYAQKINSSGVAQWTVNGVAACVAANNQQFPQLATDGSGGAIITWQDLRPATGGSSDVYAQRINSSGTVLWATDGEAVCSRSGSGAQTAPQIAPDGIGGATIAWTDGRSATNPNDIYAQRINASGNVLWTTNGAGVSTATGNQRYPFIINDGINGMIVSWQDSRSDPNRDDIYAQRINPDGTLGRVVPLILSAPRRPNDSRFQFTISGTAGRMYIVEASGNLTNWAAIATNVAPSDVFNYTNSNATNLRQFYRVKQGS